MVCCSRKTGLMVQMIIGICLSLIFTVLVIVWPTIFYNILRNMSVLSLTSFSFDLWKETPLPMYLELYLYNFTNSEDVMNDHSIRPNFVDVGPYVFKEHHVKGNITWNDNGTVTFLQRRIWNFDPELSNGDLSDQITNINVIPITAAYFVRDRSALVRLAVNSALKTFGESLVVTKTASELLFEGYEDRLLDIISELNISGLTLPFDKFGWFYGRNMSDTYDGWWTIQTGANDLNHLGDMDLWNFKNDVGFYDGECGAVKGTTGELFPPRTDPQNISVFASDVCSYITLKRNGSITVRGIEGAVFTGDDQPFDNGYTYSDEACFCPPGVVCQPPGTRNVSQCKFGAPAFVSYPHFYLADPKYTEKIDTPPPNAEDDEFKMALNLATGIPLFVRAQLQINILVQKIPLIDMFDKLPDNIFVPVLWFKQEVTITEDLASKAKLAGSIEGIMNIVFYCLIGLGIILVLVGIFVVAKYPITRSESEALLAGS